MAFFGGIKKSYPVEKLYEEMAFLAYYTHWSEAELMNMEHRERQRWCSEISKINRKVNGESEKKNIFDIYS